jgi:methyl-accepting chemotaxis protein
LNIFSRNLKFETTKFAIVAISLTTLISTGLVYVSNFGINSAKQTDGVSQAEINVLSLETKINSSISFYQLLGTANAPNPMGILNELKVTEASVLELIKKLLASNLDEGEMRRDLHKNIPLIEKSYQKLKIVGQNMVVALLDDKGAEGKALALELNSVAKELFSQTAKISTQAQQASRINSANTFQLMSQIRRLAFIFGSLTVIILVVLNLTFYRYVSHTLHQILVTLGVQVETLQQNSLKISQAVSSMSEVCSDQNRFIEKSSSAVTEITSMAEHTFQHANILSSLSAENESSAHEGKADVNKMVNAMDDISTVSKEFLQHVNGSVGALTEIAQLLGQINDKTQVINEIAFQTKLLSFNASVESARAGEAGKGFSVVASEIGVLAKVSAAAANEINSLIQGSHKKVKSVVENVESTVASMASKTESSLGRGVALAHECETKLVSIVTKASEAASKTSEIVKANQEQSQGIKQINESIMSVMANNNELVVNLEKVVNSVIDIDSQSKSLGTLVEDIKEKTLGTSISDIYIEQKTFDADQSNVMGIEKSKSA